MRKRKTKPSERGVVHFCLSDAIDLPVLSCLPWHWHSYMMVIFVSFSYHILVQSLIIHSAITCSCCLSHLVPTSCSLPLPAQFSKNVACRISKQRILQPSGHQLLQPPTTVHPERIQDGEKQDTGVFPGDTVIKNSPANAGDTGSSPGLGRSHMPRSN